MSNETYTPRWLKYLLVFGRNPPRMTHRQWIVLLLLQASGFFSNYCGVLFTMALPRIKRDLALDDHTSNLIAGILPASGLLALFVTGFADYYGRRKALLLTILPFTLFTALTAFVQTWQQFAIAQFLSTGFIVAEGLISHVFLVEEMPNAHRGWAVGALHTGSCFGSGLAMILYGVTDGRWRLLYGAASVTVALIAWLRRFLPESKQFVKRKDLKSDARSVRSGSTLSKIEAGNDTMSRNEEAKISKKVHPLLRGAALTIYITVAIDTVFGIANNIYAFSFLQEVHHLAPARVTMMGIFAGLCALGSFNLSGRLGDKYGRVTVCMLAQMLYVCAVQVFYTVHPLWLLTGVYIAKMSMGMALVTLKDTLFSELFPTDCRSISQGVLVFIASCSAPLGIALFEKLPGEKWTKISYLTAVKLCAIPFLARLPNSTPGRSLDDINDCLEFGLEIAPCQASRSIGLASLDKDSDLEDELEELSHDGI